MIKYLFNDHEFETLEEAENYISEEYAPNLYDDYLDEMYPETTIAGFNYSTSYALKEIDPIAYRCGLSDYASELFDEIEEEEEDEEDEEEEDEEEEDEIEEEEIEENED